MNINTLRRYLEASKHMGWTPNWEQLKRFAIAEKSYKKKYNITFI